MVHVQIGNVQVNLFVAKSPTEQGKIRTTNMGQHFIYLFILKEVTYKRIMQTEIKTRSACFGTTQPFAGVTLHSCNIRRELHIIS